MTSLHVLSRRSISGRDGNRKRTWVNSRPSSVIFKAMASDCCSAVSGAAGTEAFMVFGLPDGNRSDACVA